MLYSIINHFALGLEYRLRATFSRSAIQKHETNAARAAAARAAELQKKQMLYEECRNVTTHKDGLKILIREALEQYKLGREAKARIPLFSYTTYVNVYGLRWGKDVFETTGKLRDELTQELSQILDTLVDCKYELSVSIGYEEGGERGDEDEPTTVSLTLIPAN